MNLHRSLNHACHGLMTHSRRLENHAYDAECYSLPKLPIHAKGTVAWLAEHI